MTDSVLENLILDLLEWIANKNRSYRETMEAWRTSCPKLPVWEDATDRGLIALDADLVRLTQTGRALLEEHRIPNRCPAAQPATAVGER